jgi:hypothetical protein
MTGLLGLPRRLAVAIASADLIITSRVTHHIDGDALAAFYRQAAAVLRPGGWLADVRPGVRPDAWDKATGGIRYNADLPVPAGTLEAVLVRSPFPHAQVTGIAAEEARAVPGVVAVVTAADLPGGLTGRRVRDMPLLASGVARFAGEPVAVVLAQSRTPRKLRRPWSMSITRSEPRSPMRWPRSARTARWSTRRPGSTRARSLPRVSHGGVRYVPVAGRSPGLPGAAGLAGLPAGGRDHPAPGHHQVPVPAARPGPGLIRSAVLPPVRVSRYERYPGRIRAPGRRGLPAARSRCRTVPEFHTPGPGPAARVRAAAPQERGSRSGKAVLPLVDRCHLVGHRR